MKMKKIYRKLTKEQREKVEKLVLPGVDVRKHGKYRRQRQMLKAKDSA